jgi:hypothetical protein
MGNKASCDKKGKHTIIPVSENQIITVHEPKKAEPELANTTLAPENITPSAPPAYEEPVVEKPVEKKKYYRVYWFVVNNVKTFALPVCKGRYNNEYYSTQLGRYASVLMYHGITDEKIRWMTPEKIWELGNIYTSGAKWRGYENDGKTYNSYEGVDAYVRNYEIKCNCEMIREEYENESDIFNGCDYTEHWKTIILRYAAIQYLIYGNKHEFFYREPITSPHKLDSLQQKLFDALKITEKQIQAKMEEIFTVVK